LYDPLVGRFMNPDPYVQMPDYSQNFNRYSYGLNNPLKFNDPDGEVAFLVIAAYFAVNAAIDYGIQVSMNYAQGYKGKDAWFNKVDFFDVAVSGGLGAISGGASTAARLGEKVSKVGMFVLKHPELVRLGEVTLESAIDFTGEGWQPVSFDDFGKRVIVSTATYYGTKELSKVLGKKTPIHSNDNTKSLGTSRDNLLGSVENPKLKNIVNDLHRPGAQIGNGSSMDAFRFEKLTGGNVGGKSHFQKLIDYRTALLKLWQNRTTLSTSDQQVVKSLLNDIQNALSGN